MCWGKGKGGKVKNVQRWKEKRHGMNSKEKKNIDRKETLIQNVFNLEKGIFMLAFVV